MLVETRELHRLLARVEVAIRDFILRLDGVHHAPSTSDAWRETDHRIEDATIKNLQQADAFNEFLRERSFLP